MTRTIDFDAFRSEQTNEPLQLKLGGKVYDLPSSLPAALALDIVRIQTLAGPDADFSESDVKRLGSSLFGGEDRFIEILAEGAVTIDEMPELIKLVLEMYGGGPKLGNREARRKRAPRTSKSSKTGRSSKRTS